MHDRKLSGDSMGDENPVVEQNDQQPKLIWRWPAVILGPFVSACGGTIIPLSISIEVASWMDWILHPFWLITGMIALVVGLLWSLLGSHKRGQETEQLKRDKENLKSALREAKVDAAVEYTDHLGPLIHDVGTLADSQNANLGRDLVHHGIEAITKVIGVPRVRACLYSLDHVESADAAPPDLPDSLTLRPPHVGRHDAPRGSFIRGTGPVSNGVFDVIDQAKSRLIEDVDNTEHDIDCEDKIYKTFLNVPVRFKTEDLGLLSIDAPKPGSLKDAHKVFAEAVAQLIAVGILREKRKHQMGRYPRKTYGNA